MRQGGASGGHCSAKAAARRVPLLQLVPAPLQACHTGSAPAAQVQSIVALDARARIVADTAELRVLVEPIDFLNSQDHYQKE